MLGEVTSESVLSRLDAIVATKDMPDSVRKQAVRLRDRITSGVRIVFLGPPSVGKSRLCDALLGLRNCLENGQTTRVFHTKNNPISSFGETFDHSNVLQEQFSEDVLGAVEVVDPHWSLDPDEEATKQWPLLQSADVVIWCTNEFSTREADIWRTAPEALKDHSFLVLTKIDTLASGTDLDQRIEKLQAIAGEQFHRIVAISSQPTWSTENAGWNVSESLLSGNGMKTLKDALATVVASGRRADFDQVTVFVERHYRPDMQLSVVEPMQEELNTTRATEIAELHAMLTEQSFDLAEMIFDADSNDMTNILQACGNVAQELAEAFSDGAYSFGLAPDWSTALEMAPDKVILMALENDTRSAADAATILLQLRRDLEYLIAA